MKQKYFGKGYWKTFSSGIEREWVITNGIGGYAGSSIIGAHTRKHHGLLIASLHPPVERFMVFSKINESLKIGETDYNLSTNQRTGHTYEEGQHYLQRFLFDCLPTFIYDVQGVHITKSIAMEYGHNTTAIHYELYNGSENTTLTLTPLFNFRDHNDGCLAKDLCFSTKLDKQTLLLTHDSKTISFYCSEGTFKTRKEEFDRNLELQTEMDTGMSSFDNNYTPYDITISLEPFEKRQISIVCSLEQNYCKDASTTILNAKRRGELLIKQAGFTDDFANSLVLAADNFIVHRDSTGYKTVLAGLPWFTDWGRDTMIALQGLTLITKRCEDAKGILKTFAMYIKDGLVPNMFPDAGLDPLYNTVDASLWYFYCVWKYLEYTGSDADYEFIRTEIYDKLVEIINAYKKGTHFSIYMDEDHLIHAGGGLDQVTWMDVRVDDWVVTPRHGKPVEINALWYNALCIMTELSQRFQKDSIPYQRLAEQVKEAFCKKFWNPKLKCLYDVIEDGDKGDARIRPNQIWAVSLPFTMLSKEQEKCVVDVVHSHLYASYGLRSLSPADPEYKGIYFGELHDRDGAYHQGTVWGFPLGGFISAYVKVHDYTPESVSFAEELLAPMKDHLMDGCINQIAEIFDGDEPHISRGCYGQAWSVGEVLRTYAEDILQHQQERN